MASPAPVVDLMLRSGAEAGRFDLVIAGGDLALDATPVTAMLVSLGSDRRARADDALPQAPDAVPIDPQAPPVINPRRGWPGDALDMRGRRLGSRLWLLERAKAGAETRRRGAIYAAEALAWLEAERGHALALDVDWARPGVLAIVARAGTAELRVQRSLGA